MNELYDFLASAVKEKKNNQKKIYFKNKERIIKIKIIII
jgi:hypothetical protein